MVIKRNTLVVNSGISRSNGNGYFILWPKDPQKSADDLRSYLKRRFNLQCVGVVISDSKTTPLRWGESGIAISYSGFRPLNDYLKKSDIFGHKLKYKKVNVVDRLAAAAVLIMGEGNEQTPLAVVTNLPFVEFTSSKQTKKELDSLHIELAEDVYAELIKSVKWKKGGSNQQKISELKDKINYLRAKSPRNSRPLGLTSPSVFT